jgi:hypothetical protein
MGRPKGSLNKRTQEVLDLIQGRGDTDPLDALSKLITTSQDPNIVATASNMLAPYVHSKRGTLPAPRFIPEQIEVPTFTSIDKAEDYLNDLSVRLGHGELDSQSALELGSLVKQWIDSRRAGLELDLKIAAQNHGPNTTIRIEGGLPSLPGTNVIMDDTAVAVAVTVNGHNGSAINGQGPIIDHTDTPALTESIPSQVPDEGQP